MYIYAYVLFVIEICFQVKERRKYFLIYNLSNCHKSLLRGIHTTLYFIFATSRVAIRHSFGFNLPRIDHWQRCVFRSCTNRSESLEERKERERERGKRRKVKYRNDIFICVRNEMERRGNALRLIIHVTSQNVDRHHGAISWLPCERSSALPTLQVTVLSGWMSYRILRRKSKKEKRREEYFVLDTAVNSSGSKSSEFYFKSKILMLDRNVPRAKDSDSTALTIDSLPSDNFWSAFILGRERFTAYSADFDRFFLKPMEFYHRSTRTMRNGEFS